MWYVKLFKIIYFVFLTIFAREMGIEYSVLSHETCCFQEFYTSRILYKLSLAFLLKVNVDRSF